MRTSLYYLCFGTSMGLLLACQAQAPTPTQEAKPHLQQQLIAPAQLGGAMHPISLKQEPLNISDIQIKDQGNQQAHISVTLQLNQPDNSPSNFRAQALNTSQITRIWAGIRGINIAQNSPILANEADNDGYIISDSGSFTLTFSNVPYGAIRTLFVGFYDNNGLIAPGAYIFAGFALNSANTPVELSFRTTPLGEVLNILREMHLPPLANGTEPENNYVLAQIDLSALQNLIDNITGVSGTAPNYEYIVHPTFVNTAALATDLKNANGNVASLNPANPTYKHPPANLTFNLAGLLAEDTATAIVRDPASKAITDLSNGSTNIASILGQLAPEDRWVLEVHAPGYISHTQELQIARGQDLDLGVITLLVNNTPVLSNISTNSGTIASQITLSGSGFHPNILGNAVRFGSHLASISTASATELIVTVPAGISGAQSISVTVGDKVSNTQSFALTPEISGLSANSGQTGSNLTLTGTGFSSVLSENMVRLNGVLATIIAASSTELQINVPATTSGNLTVQVGNQTSNSLPFKVLSPTVITGSVGP